VWITPFKIVDNSLFPVDNFGKKREKRGYLADKSGLPVHNPPDLWIKPA
jgi:hypothetical protein